MKDNTIDEITIKMTGKEFYEFKELWKKEGREEKQPEQMCFVSEDELSEEGKDILRRTRKTNEEKKLMDKMMNLLLDKLKLEWFPPYDYKESGERKEKKK